MNDNFISEENFESLFRSYYADLVSFASHYVEDWEKADEIVQDTFSNIWAKIHETHIRTTAKSYLYGAIRHACLNEIKHGKVIQKHLNYEKSHFEEAFAVDFLEFSELKIKVQKALEELPAKCREVFELSRFDGMKYQEIATHMDISIKTVERHMGKALKVMRDRLGHYLPIIIWFFSK